MINTFSQPMLNNLSMPKSNFSHIEKQQIGDRIRSLMNAKSIRPVDVAKYCGVSSGMGSNWPNGVAVPQNENLHLLSELLGVSWRYILYGEEDPQFSMTEAVTASEWDSTTPLGDGEVEVPLFNELEIAAGDGSEPGYEHRGKVIRFSESSLRETNVRPESAFFVKLPDNSMEPNYEKGGEAGFDRGATRIINGEEYAIDHDGLARFKILYRLPGGKVRISSYNSDEYPDEVVSEGDIRVIGQLFSYRKMKPTG